jgi:hypothetical protein
VVVLPSKEVSRCELGRPQHDNGIHPSASQRAATAQTIGLDFPEVKGGFRRPRPNTNDQTLLATARAFAVAATPLKPRFVEYDMPADFLDQLSASIANFEQTVNRQNLGTDGPARP